jgi:hypothetical protein
MGWSGVKSDSIEDPGHRNGNHPDCTHHVRLHMKLHLSMVSHSISRNLPHPADHIGTVHFNTRWGRNFRTSSVRQT